MELSAPAPQHPAADSSDSKLSEEELFGPRLPDPAAAAAGARAPRPAAAVLLVDEIDRADDDFEAFLLELLARRA